MWSICYSLHAVAAPTPWSIFINKSSFSTKSTHFFPTHSILKASLKDDSSSSSIPNQTQMGYDHAQELYGLDVDIPPRDAKSDASEPRSWFGPNGQYIRELPCPSCRGRGYTPCAECGIERSRKDCSVCSGKGIITCQQCSGECVIWEETIDEIPWEKARSSSPVKVKDDDEVDNLDLKLDVRRKSKRVYRSTPEVGLKISRSLKSLNERTGLFSKRMKIIHQDPALHAQRVAAIKKTKRTDAARKQASEALKSFFSDPENRRRRSISMKGTKFFCKKCGQEGHRSHYCPENGKNIDRRLKCGLCGQRGHNRKTCGRPSTPKIRILPPYHCGACGQIGHNRRTCSAKAELNIVGDLTKNGSSEKAEPQLVGTITNSGNSMKVEPQLVGDLINCGSSGAAEPYSVGDLTKNGNSLNDSTGHFQKHYRCSVCEQLGHNSRTCSMKGEAWFVNDLTEKGSSENREPRSVGDLTTKGNSLNDTTGHVRKHYRCSVCDQLGHNSRTCSLKGEPWLVADPTENASSVKAEPQLVGDLAENGSWPKAEPHSVGYQTENGSSVNREARSVGDLTTNGNSLNDTTGHVRKHYRCSICEQLGHNRRTCSLKGEPWLVGDPTSSVKAEPQLVGDLTENGSWPKAEPHSVGYQTENVNPLHDSTTHVPKHHRCSICEQLGHNCRTCDQKSGGPVDILASKKTTRRHYHCGNCGVIGHNRRTCLKQVGE